MYQVVPEQVSQLKRFFSARPPANAPMLHAFFEHRAPGRAFVNDFRAPTACVVAMHYRFVFFGGDVSPHFYESALRELRRSQALLVVMPANISRSPRRPAPDDDVHRVEFSQRIDPDRIKVRGIQRSTASLGEVRRIDPVLFHRCMWRDEIVRLLGGANEFLMHGIGYCLLREGQIVAEAYGCLWTRDRVEMAAITHPDHRGRGYATAVCAHLIDTCEAVGFETYWSCDAHNEASLKLATKLGYDGAKDYRMFRYEQLPAVAAPTPVMA